jgi:hypothetical protein
MTSEIPENGAAPISRQEIFTITLTDNTTKKQTVYNLREMPDDVIVNTIAQMDVQISMLNSQKQQIEMQIANTHSMNGALKYEQDRRQRSIAIVSDLTSLGGRGPMGRHN